MTDDTICDFADVPLFPDDKVIDPNGGIWTVCETDTSIWLRGRAVTCRNKQGKTMHLRQVMIIKVDSTEITKDADLRTLFSQKAEFSRRRRRAILLGRKQRMNDFLVEEGIRK